MLTRRKFLQNSTSASVALLVNPTSLFNNHAAGKLEISLAEWSLHRTIREGKLDHLDFPAKARSFGINAVEYVNGLFGTKTIDFKSAAIDKKYLGELLKRSNDAGVVNHLVMVDEEGHLAGLDEKARKKAVEDHKKWIDAAKF